MRKFFLTAAMAMLTMIPSGCQAQNDKPFEIKDNNTTVSEPLPPLVTLTDFSEVAARTIDAVVHIMTKVVKQSNSYDDFFGALLGDLKKLLGLEKEATEGQDDQNGGVFSGLINFFNTNQGYSTS